MANTWEPALAIKHLQKLVTAYYKDNPKKPIMISVPIDTAPQIARPTAPLMSRLIIAAIKKRGQPAKSTTTISKRAKKF